MSEHMKSHHTRNAVEVMVQDEKYVVPWVAVDKFKLFTFLKPYHVACHKEEASVPADEVFKELDQKYGKVGATIRGYRVRDDLTQVALAKRLNVSLYYLSQIENGGRTVDKKIAHKLAKIFRTSYRLFV